MNTIDKIRAEIERRLKRENELIWNAELRGIAYPPSVDFNLLTLTSLRDFLDTLEAETSYDIQQYTPSPFVDIGDVARVQFASHAKVFDKKRKAVFDWEQFKEIASIFYGFGKRDSQEIKEKEQPTMGYDEAYMNEKIAKASKSWEGVDVDEYMDEVRGREPANEDLEKEIDSYFKKWWMDLTDQGYILRTPDGTVGLISVKNIARRFAEWGAEHLKK